MIYRPTPGKAKQDRKVSNSPASPDTYRPAPRRAGGGGADGGGLPGRVLGLQPQRGPPERAIARAGTFNAAPFNGALLSILWCIT